MGGVKGGGGGLKAGLGAAALGGALLLARLYGAQGLLRACFSRIQEMGAWGPPAFLLLYVIACLLFFPGSVLTLGGGFVFGFARGVVFVSAGSTLGATAAFLAGRYLARDWVARRIEADERFKAIDRAVAKEGWKIVLLTRLSPAFPFNLLNYAFGLTRVPLRDYVLASWAGMLPATLLYVYLGSLAGDLASAGGRGRGARTPGEWALYAAGLAATAAVALYVAKLARRALAQAAPPVKPRSARS